MSAERARLADRAESLRQAFDRAFAEPRGEPARPTENLLAISIGSEPYALRLSEIAGLFVDRKVTRLPGGDTALLGLSGFRGAIVPVYDLHALLGRPAVEASRWLAIAAGAPVALAFETLAGHLRVAPEAILPREADAQSMGLVREFVSTDGPVRPVVHLAAVIDAILKQRPATTRGEREG
jgi:purine-binding chemotaxis protein CheW